MKANIKNAKLGKLLENFTASCEVKSRAREMQESEKIKVQNETIEGEKVEQLQLQQLKTTFNEESKMT